METKVTKKFDLEPDQLFDLNYGITTLLKQFALSGVHDKADSDLTPVEWAGVYMVLNLQSEVQDEIKRLYDKKYSKPNESPD